MAEVKRGPLLGSTGVVSFEKPYESFAIIASCSVSVPQMFLFC